MYRCCRCYCYGYCYCYELLLLLLLLLLQLPDAYCYGMARMEPPLNHHPPLGEYASSMILHNPEGSAKYP